MAKAKKPTKKKTGRPSVYDPVKYPQIAERMCWLGATNEDIAKALGVALSTFGEWMKSKPAFSVAVNSARENADAAVVKSLYQRANGYSHKSQKMQLDRAGKWQVLEFTEHYPPDPTSMIFWLKNRKPKDWREKLDIEQKVLTVIVEGENPENEA